MVGAVEAGAWVTGGGEGLGVRDGVADGVGDAVGEGDGEGVAEGVGEGLGGAGVDGVSVSVGASRSIRDSSLVRVAARAADS